MKINKTNPNKSLICVLTALTAMAILLSFGCGPSNQVEKKSVPSFDAEMPRLVKRMIDSVGYALKTKDIKLAVFCFETLSKEMADLAEVKTGLFKQELERQSLAIDSLINKTTLNADTVKQWSLISTDFSKIFPRVEVVDVVAPPEDAGIIKHIESELGFTIWIPQWLANISYERKTATTSVGFSNQAGGPTSLLTVKVSQLNGQPALTQAFDDYTNQLHTRMNVEIDVIGFSIIDGFPAYCFDLTTTDQSGAANSILRQYYLIHNLKIYVIGYGASNIIEFNSIMERYEEVLDTLVLHEKKVGAQ